MDHTGINGRAAKPHEKKAGLAVAASRKQKDQKARRQDPSTQADHAVVTDPLRKEAADCPSGRDPQIEKTGQGGGAQKRIGKAQAYERQIDHCQKYMCHGPAPKSLRNIRPGSRPLIPVHRKTPAHGRSGAQLPYIPLKHALIPLWRPRPDGWWARPEEGCWSPG